MKRKVVCTTLILLCFLSLELFSQSTDKDEKKLIKEAQVFFDDGDFANALPLYLELIKKYPKDPLYNFCLGVSYLSLAPNETENISKDKAIPFLEIANRSLHMNDINYYLGYAYHLNYDWDKAIHFYGKYRDSLEYQEPYYLTPLLQKKEEFARIVRQIEMCESGKILLQDTAQITFTNLGLGINSKYPDYAPAISADDEVLIFTSRRPPASGEGKVTDDFFFYEDIFITYKVNNKWVEAIRIGENVNTKKHNASIGLSADAQTLFVYEGGDIYMSVLDGLEWTKPKKLGKAINTSYWETHITMTSAQNTIYFVSDRKGGYGGRDIYRAYLLEDGSWGRVENLGPTINTPDDEEAPFIHPDERTLYFSSNGHNSMGGFDIFLANLIDGVWEKPENMGYPINTTGDDIYFTISSNGKSGYMSTIRKGGVGEKDIFIAHMPDTGDVPLTVIRGLIKDDEGNPIRAEFVVMNRETNKLVGRYKSNSVSGKYLLVFPPGSDYDVIISAADYVAHTEHISIPDQNRFYDLFQEIQLSSASRTEADGSDSVIGQQIVVRNAFFDIDSVIAVADESLTSIEQKELAYSFFLGDLEFNTPEERLALANKVKAIEGVGSMVEDYQPLEQIHITEGVGNENLEMHVLGFDTVFTTSSSTVTHADEDSLITAGIKLEEAYYTSRAEVDSTTYDPELYFATKGLKEGIEEVLKEEDSLELAVNTVTDASGEAEIEVVKEEEDKGAEEAALAAETAKAEEAKKAEEAATLLAIEAAKAEDTKKAAEAAAIAAEATKAEEAKKAEEAATLAAEIAKVEEEKKAKEAAALAAEKVTMEELEKELVVAEEAKVETESTQDAVDLIDKKFILSSVYFDFNSSVLNTDSRKAIDALWGTLNKASNLKVEISGHTDNMGEAAYNQLLSLARANSVVKYLISKGISSNRLVAKGYGATNPMEPNTFSDGRDNPAGRKSNRRTELKVIGVTEEVASGALASTATTGIGIKGGELSVTEGGICTSVVDRAPVGSANSFSSAIERLYYFSNITAQDGEKGTVTHVWYFEGEKMAEISLIYEGPRWRTFSSKRIVPIWKGKWKVEVVSATGAILKSTKFTVK